MKPTAQLEQIVEAFTEALEQVIETRAAQIIGAALERPRRVKHARARRPLPQPAPPPALEQLEPAPPPPPAPPPLELVPPIEEPPAFAVQLARQHLSNDPATGHVRGKTISGHLRRDERRAAALVVYPDVERPWMRGDCKDGPRPCPFVSCRHHLYLDVTPTGGLLLNFPHLELEELADTCSLDVADRGGAGLTEVGALLNVSRQRAQQIEVVACTKAGSDAILHEHEQDGLPAAAATG